MIPVGGYQMIDFGGAVISTDAATTINNPEIAAILRSTTKPVHFYNIKIGEVLTDSAIDLRTDTGATDGKMYGFVAPNSMFYNVTTDDGNVTFTPA